jgi:hypothetical protein
MPSPLINPFVSLMVGAVSGNLPGRRKALANEISLSEQEQITCFRPIPVIGPKDARERRDEARKLLANSIDPSAIKRAQKAAAQERAVK